LKRLARDLRIERDVIFAGFVPDIWPFLERSSGFVLASRYEAFSLVLVEALAAGLPIISYDCPTGPAEVLDGGKFGRLIPSGDVDGLARGMRDIISGEIRGAPTNLVAKHLERYAPAQIAVEYADFVGELFNSQRR
jgi:glycosyltransferase involved in cell wall biosynthesis